MSAVLVKIYRPYKMASVFFKDEGMSGNFWDFKNEVHGMYDLPKFSCYESLAKILSQKHNVPIVSKEVDWDKETNWFKE